MRHACHLYASVPLWSALNGGFLLLTHCLWALCRVPPPHFASGRRTEAPAQTAAPALLPNPAAFVPAVERRGAPGWMEPDKVLWP